MRKVDIVSPCAVSCVENYFLAWCKDNDIPQELLFGTSYLSFKTILDDFASGRQTYENYKRIPRLQEYAETIGIIGHQRLLDLESVRCLKTELTLMKVNSHFFKGYRRVPWRDDHYIVLLDCINKKYHYLSSYPLEEGYLDSNELKNVFGGSVLVYRLNGDLDFKKRDKDIQIQFESIIHAEELPEEVKLDNLQYLRDAVAILRVSRARTIAWQKSLHYSLLWDTEISDLLEKQKTLLDRLFLTIGIAMVRTPPANYFTEQLSELSKLETQISKEVKMRRIINEQT